MSNLFSNNNIISRSRPLYKNGTIISQIAAFNSSKTLHKASVNLTVTNDNKKDFIVGSNGVASFQAANFWESRDSWVFHPVMHWSPSKNWETSGMSIENTLQSTLYSSEVDAAFNAPYLKYQVFLDMAGIYNIWGYGYTSDGVFWSWNDDTTHMRRFTLGSVNGPPEWTKIGTIESPEGGLHTFAVYLSDASTVVLDQWYFTQDTDDLSYPFTPRALSEAPFNIGIRVRSLNNGNLDDLENPVAGSQRAVSWASSKTIVASGIYNFELQNTEDGSGVIFTNGVSIDLWQLGGGSKHFAAWDFTLTDESVGNAFVSNDHGQNFIQE